MNEDQALAKHQEGQQYQVEGLHKEALHAFAVVAEYFEASDGPQSPDLANVLLDQTESLLYLCRYEEAEQSARRAKEIVESIQQLLDADIRALLLPRAYGLWGQTLRDLGHYEEAAPPLLAAIEHSLPEARATYLNNYGVLCKYWGRFDEGEQSYLRALDLLEDQFGKDAPETATVYHNLGGLEHSRGHFAKGEPLGRKAWEIRRKALGDDHEATVADAVAWGGLLDGLRRYSESVAIYRRALRYYETRFGPNHFEVAATLNNLGLARAAQGQRQEAQELLARSLRIKHDLFGENHPETVLARRNLSSIL